MTKRGTVDSRHVGAVWQQTVQPPVLHDFPHPRGERRLRNPITIFLQWNRAALWALAITGLAELPCTAICSETTSAWKMTGKNTSRIHLNVNIFSHHPILSPPPFSIPSLSFYANRACKRLVRVFDFWFLCCMSYADIPKWEQQER